jgi:hypothetical protein
MFDHVLKNKPMEEKQDEPKEELIEIDCTSLYLLKAMKDQTLCIMFQSGKPFIAIENTLSHQS